MGTGIRMAAAGLALALSAPSAYGAGKCEGDSARFRIMPPVIGRPGATARSPYDLPCDSMIVPQGQTTIIYGSSMVDFGTDPDRGGKIVVKGKLVIEGKPGNPAYLAGSVVSTSTGYAPGEKPWAGVQVDSGAVLRISHARFYKAPAALVLRSRDLILKNCFFQGASALALPDTTLALNPMGQSLSTLDYREGKSGLSASGKERPGVFWPRVRKAGKWVAGGVGVLAVSGGIWWAATHVPGKQSAPPAPDAPGGLDAAPALPDPAAARP